MESAKPPKHVLEKSTEKSTEKSNGEGGRAASSSSSSPPALAYPPALTAAPAAAAGGGGDDARLLGAARRRAAELERYVAKCDALILTLTGVVDGTGELLQVRVKSSPILLVVYARAYPER